MCSTVLILPGGSCQVASLAEVEVTQNHHIWKHSRPPPLCNTTQSSVVHHTSTRLDLTRPTRRYNPSKMGPASTFSYTTSRGDCVPGRVSSSLSSVTVSDTVNMRRPNLSPSLHRCTAPPCLYRAATVHLSMSRSCGRDRYSQIAAASPVDPPARSMSLLHFTMGLDHPWPFCAAHRHILALFHGS